MVWIWPGEALYAGPSLHLDQHSGSAACLAVGVDGPLEIAADGETTLARSAFIPPRVPNRITSAGQRMAFYFVEPGSARERACQAKLQPGNSLRQGHEHERELVELGGLLADRNAVQRWVEYATGNSANTPDERVRAALETLRADPDISAARLATGVHLSTSHFLRLFKRDTGTTLRRYRIWTRMLTTAAGIASGADLTTASMAAGFASPSHFSATFHATFGLSPTQLLSTPVDIRPMPAGPSRQAIGH